MSSNGSNDTQVSRLDSLFGSQGSTRNFTSLLNPSYLQASNGKESHKRETDGKCFYMFVFEVSCIQGIFAGEKDVGTLKT